MRTHFAIGGDEADALKLQRAVTALVAVSRIGSACEIQCRRLNADDGVRPNSAVFRRDPGLKNRCRFQPPGMVHGSDRGGRSADVAGGARVTQRGIVFGAAFLLVGGIFLIIGGGTVLEQRRYRQH